MNARSQTSFAAIAEQFTAGNPAPWAYTETPLSWEMARDEFRANTERFGSWMQNVDGKRLHAVMFPEGPISASELLAVMLNDSATAQQCQEAAKELGRRYVSDVSDEIAERAYQLATRS